MRLKRLRPMKAVDSIRREVSRWVARCPSPVSAGWMGSGEERVIRLPLDIFSTFEEIVIRAAVPGLGPADVEVTLGGSVLTIQGRFPAPLPSIDYLVQEQMSGPFRREVAINVPVHADRAEARFDQGILTVILPKNPDVRPRLVEVQARLSG
jgi:HSP20 family protein